MQDEVHTVVSRAIDRLNELLPANEPLSKDIATVLLGAGGVLDSMGFVNLIVALEDELEKQVGVKAILADEVTGGEGICTVGDLHEVLRRVVRDRNPSGDTTAVRIQSE